MDYETLRIYTYILMSIGYIHNQEFNTQRYLASLNQQVVFNDRLLFKIVLLANSNTQEIMTQSLTCLALMIKYTPQIPQMILSNQKLWQFQLYQNIHQ